MWLNLGCPETAWPFHTLAEMHHYPIAETSRPSLQPVGSDRTHAWHSPGQARWAAILHSTECREGPHLLLMVDVGCSVLKQDLCPVANVALEHDHLPMAGQVSAEVSSLACLLVAMPLKRLRCSMNSR